MSGEWLNAAHLGAIQPEALIRSCRTCIHRLMIPRVPSPFLEEHNPPDKTSPAVTLQFLPLPDALLAPHGLPFSDKLCPPARLLSDAAHELSDLDSRSKPSRNKPSHRTSQPFSLTSIVSPLYYLRTFYALHGFSSSPANLDCPPQSSWFQPRPVPVSD
ncbi:hypothetical protein CRENBAI_012404 [Crenichthys baileyi]|uniref:Uncharacterized protein n=1 Tax=Crenichthys baileyi TaxID=28760 RepID=A0AAV9R2A1_9TELE